MAKTTTSTEVREIMIQATS